MKPNFALTLSFDGIGLLHRSKGGWLLVGEVPLNDPDLANALQDLVSKAHTLEPSGISTKLVIPNQQIRYLQFESDSRDIDILEAQVRSTLNGATPYHVSELAYDWSMTEGDVCVAAVAIETLTEAESFAVDHGFSPLSFVAVPEADAFQGEPFFGETVHAGELLTPGDSVKRDEDAIRIAGKVALPDPDPVTEQEDLREDERDANVEPLPLSGFQSARTAPPPENSEAADPQPRVEVTEARIEEPAEEPTEPPTQVVAFSSARRPSAPDTPASTPGSALPEGRFKPGAPDATPSSTPSADMDQSGRDVRDVDANTDASPPFSSARPKTPPAPNTPQDAPPQDAPPQSSFRIPPAPDFEDPLDLATPPAPEAATQQPTAIRPAEKPATAVSQHPGSLPFLSSRNADPKARTSPRATKKDSARKWGIDVRAGIGKTRTAVAGLAGAAANLRPKPAPSSAAERSAAQAVEDERKRMTVFGARNPESSSTENNPRFLALALTAGLLLLLVGIAAWAALFLENGVSSLFRSSEDVQVAQETDPVDTQSQAPTEPEFEIAAQPDIPEADTEELADEPLATLQPSTTISEELSPDEARTRYAATGIWQLSPTASQAPIALQFQDVYQTSLDPDLNFSDAVALPSVSLLLPSARPATPLDPLAPGEDNIARDERGFALATPEGTVSSEGVTIFAGAPPITPPETPERAVAEPEPERVPETVETALAAQTPETQSQGLRPRSRPTNLTDSFERTNNGGLTLDELQGVRPRLRPQSAQEQALAEAGITPEIEDDAENQLEDATREAVAVSVRPRTRPQNFARVVEETRETAASEPVSIEQRVQVSIPTTASVARAATERNQIALRRVNLIGVYGSTDSRRALVRLPNGRYRKVKVGDRLDGGQVAAIGSDELRYIKRGQSVVLKMPKS